MKRAPRQAISIPEPQMAYLRKLAGRHGITIADVIRRIISEHMDANDKGKLK